jgi:hypothetical protein
MISPSRSRSPSLALPLALALAFPLSVGCGSTPAPSAETPAGSEPASSDSAPANLTGDTIDGMEPASPAAGSSAPAESAAPASDSASLARDFVKSGGRRIGYSESKKGFAVPLRRRQGDGTYSLDVQFVGEDGNARDVMRVCQPGECEEKLDEIARTFIPKLAARFDEQGYVSLRGVGWPQGKGDLELSTLGLKLTYSKGKLEAKREGKPAARVSETGGKRLDAPMLEAVFVVPGSKLLGVFASSSADAAGSEFYVLKLP